MQFNPQYTQIATGLADQKRKLPSPPEQYSQPGTPTPGQFDPYKSTWTSGSWHGLVGPSGEAGSGAGVNQGTDAPSVSGLPGENQLPANFWAQQGYTGPVSMQNEGGEYRFDTPWENSNLTDWAKANGYTPGYTDGYGGVLKDGQIVPGSAFGNRTNDDATFIAGALGIGAAGAAAGGLFGGGVEAGELVGSLAGTEGLPAGMEIIPATGVEAGGATALGEAGGYGFTSAEAAGTATQLAGPTGGGLLGELGGYASQAGQFLKQNPQLAQAGTAALLARAGDKPGAAPTLGAGGSTGSPAASANIQALTDALAARLSGTVNQANDFSKVPGLQTNAGDPKGYSQEAADAIYSQQTRYLDPQVKIQQQALEARLAEQGFVPGTPGYAQAMQVFQDTNARAYGAARDAATAQGVTAGRGYFADSLSNANLNNSASRETLAQMLAQRNQPFNELASLRTGNQIDAKQQYDADSDRYNASVAESNSKNQSNALLINGLLQYFSDARLKDDIQPAGQTPGGANLYTYSIFGRRERGVLAQELILTQPEAVSVDPETGFFLVNYAKVR